MKDNLKKQVAEAAKTYIEEKGISINELSRRAEMNQSYVSQILSEKGETISDKWYLKLAKTIGFAVEHNYWDHVNTPQYRAIVGYLDEARATGRNRILIGSSGSGKTYAVDRYVMNRPSSTYKLTASMQHSTPRLIEDLLTALAIDAPGHTVYKTKAIANRLSFAQASSAEPLVIIDEAENMDLRAFAAVKLLYDLLEGVCPIVLIGTEQIERKIDRMVRLNMIGMPQFVRRFKAGRRTLPGVDRTFKMFLDDKVEDVRLKNLLRRICDNYGELHDYLGQALHDADQMGADLTYELFCEIHSIPTK